MSPYLAQLREGHLEAVYNLFAYLNKSPHLPIVLDDKALRMNGSAFEKTA